MIVAGALAAVLLGVKLVPAGQGEGGSAAGPASAAGVTVERRREAAALVHVAGAVRRPGVYRVGPGARVRDAVRRAGGPRRTADVDAVNLAAPVTDGQQVVVPSRPPAGASPGAPKQAPVSLGSATAQELDTLDGVGPVMAQKIVEWRSQNGGVTSVEELDQVPGIGPKTIETLRDQLSP